MRLFIVVCARRDILVGRTRFFASHTNLQITQSSQCQIWCARAETSPAALILLLRAAELIARRS